MQRAERQGLTRLVNELGAEITVSMNFMDWQGDRWHAKAREGVEQIVSCQWPSYRAPVIATVIHQADMPRNQVSMLRSTLQQHGLNPGEDVAWVAFDGIGAATRLALTAAGAHSVLLVGVSGLTAWRDDLQMRQLVGGTYPAVIGGWSYLAGVVESPGAVLRESVQAKDWRQTIGRWVDQVLAHEADRDPTELLSWRCVYWQRDKEKRCDAHAWCWDELGAPWCRAHGEKGWDTARRVQTKHRVAANREGQGEML